mmetsp:Transcript_124418/g.397927  ORF Transcript_124418/g.397927 Transcript_124418/m.397927 type:complete len:270 (+) Transcript_124418:1393-2202(+)
MKSSFISHAPHAMRRCLKSVLREDTPLHLKGPIDHQCMCYMALCRLFAQFLVLPLEVRATKSCAQLVQQLRHQHWRGPNHMRMCAMKAPALGPRLQPRRPKVHLTLHKAQSSAPAFAPRLALALVEQPKQKPSHASEDRLACRRRSAVHVWRGERLCDDNAQAVCGVIESICQLFPELCCCRVRAVARCRHRAQHKLNRGNSDPEPSKQWAAVLTTSTWQLVKLPESGRCPVAEEYLAVRAGLFHPDRGTQAPLVFSNLSSPLHLRLQV